MSIITRTATAVALVAIAGAETTVAHPGHTHGKAHKAGDHGPRAVAPASTSGHVQQVSHVHQVGHVFHGTVVASAADAITVDLRWANRHGRRVLAQATPPVVISRASSTDLLRVALAPTARIIRNRAAGAPQVGDRVAVKYRAPHSRHTSAWAPGGVATVTVAGLPPAAEISGSGVTLRWVVARGPAPS